MQMNRSDLVEPVRDMFPKIQTDIPNIGLDATTLIELLQTRALRQSDQPAYTFLSATGLSATGARTSEWNYGVLDQRSRLIAAHLLSRHLTGERAILLYPPGLDYLAAFFGCLYAGVIAVPAYPPRNERNSPRILSIARDAQVGIALTTSSLLPNIQSLLKAEIGEAQYQWLATDTLDPDLVSIEQPLPLSTPETIAMLQYTSGSTGTPKGVMLSHRNLLHNATVTYQVMAHSAASRFISWLPIYHDMGLIGGVLQPLYGGFPCTLMAPATFLQSPYCWLKAISDDRGTTSGAPNFAYELCIQKITPAQIETLDLSSWTVAFNGAEPIRAETLQRFSQKFASCGFQAEAFYPCYGMAEATLMVTGGDQQALPQSKTISKSALENNHVVEVLANTGEPFDDLQVLVGCGQTMPEQRVTIVHPDTLQRCLPQEVGEIWVAGPSVGEGYWQRSNETTEIFQAVLANGEGPFLRTGDLGFFQGGELFVTGRLKDLIIIRGRNLYPQDIEQTVEQSHPSLRLGSGAAFTVTIAQIERLVVVQELEFRQKPDLVAVMGAIRQGIAAHHEVQVYGVVLIKPGSLPKTSSGKIQRKACCTAFLQGNLKVIAQSILPLSEENRRESTLNREHLLVMPSDARQDCLLADLQNRIAQVLELPFEMVEPQHPLSQFGLDSLKAFELKCWIEKDFGIALSIVDLFDCFSLEQLSQQILTQVQTLQLPPCLQTTIPPIDRTHQLPLGLAQERLWFLSQLEPESPFYTVPIALHLQGDLDISRLEQSLQGLIERHEVLRTSFIEKDGHPFQIIQSTGLLGYELEHRQVDNVAHLQIIVQQSVNQPFNLTQSPLMRGLLLALSEQQHLLLLTFHHIIADGWSIAVFIEELATLYTAFGQGKPSPLPELPIQYADFAVWQRQWLQSDSFQTQLSYWCQQLQGSLPVLQLKFDRPRPAMQTYAGKQHALTVSKTITDLLKALSKTAGTTLFMTLLAAFYALLYCNTPQDEILIGSPIAGRQQSQTTGLFGFFVNTLVLRTRLTGNPTFLELLARVRSVALGSYAHPEVPFEKLVEVLQPQRSLCYNPLFQVMFIFQNAAIPPIELPGLTISPQNIDGGTSKFDLKLSLWETSDELAGSLEYKTDLFDATTIMAMANQLDCLLRQVTTQPNLTLNELAHQLAKDFDALTPEPIEISNHQKLKLAKRKAISSL
jgi:acyl-CoA synthetase (AMP-forming)/AMP-acid ligase II/acyl carrier protein